ncbi:glycosyltransferase family 2 protein [Marinobacter sp. LN3S78]|uniref:glycosyltransferase family 2 protein n=1 Tax=Marinobacter sp. LN3S78 TaxID=3382300 RepID=UPI00387B87FA
MRKVKFSIVLPVFNEEEHIDTCLKSILSSSLPNDQYEVIAVDNGSQDRSAEIIKYHNDVIYISAPNCNVGRVRNLGARAASGDYLIFLDSDCTIGSAWLEQKLELIREHPETVFGGGILLPDRPTWIERFWTLQSEDRSELPKRLIGASILTPKRTFFLAGEFNETVTSGEDSEFHGRLTDLKITVNLTNDMDVTHLGNAKTATNFVRRQIWHSENYIQDIRSSIKDPIFILTATFVLLFFSLAISVITSGSKTKIAAIIVMLLIVPAILTFKRIHRARSYKLRFIDLPKLYIIDLLYLVGRGIGLLSSVFITAQKSKQPDPHY